MTLLFGEFKFQKKDQVTSREDRQKCYLDIRLFTKRRNAACHRKGGHTVIQYKQRHFLKLQRIFPVNDNVSRHCALLVEIFLFLTQKIINRRGVLDDSVNKNSGVAAAGVSEEYANQALTLLIPTDDRDTYT